MLFYIIALVFGLFAGFAIGVTIRHLQKMQKLRVAEIEAERLVDEAKGRAEELMDDAKARGEELAESLYEENEKELEQMNRKVQHLEEQHRNKRSQGDREYNADLKEVQAQLAAIETKDRAVQDRQTAFSRIQLQAKELQQQLLQKLGVSSGQDLANVRTQLAAKLEDDMQVEARRKAAAIEDDVRLHAEDHAKRLINTALSRFPREACHERGIGIVEIPNANVEARMLGPNGETLKMVGSLCGVDVSLTENKTLQIAGFDPVRRMLATRTLERLLHERVVNEQVIERIFEKCKRDLFQKIEDDGRKVAAEMGQQSLHPEIKRMLGSLRYRYSFAQNQHFHVAEVGWLCGLMASELGKTSVADAKRSGLLHDVGKAMDHSIDGGHAVIGADFIQKHGEEERIVHAVRAHHFEEQPNSDIAFLVIAADAVSGARPGARRSTVSVYNQKMEVLSGIGEGIEGVNKTLVFNAGREVRLLVDGNRVSDERALSLCREVAEKIEQTLSYPGQIKVMVVRETHAEAFAK